MCPPAVPFRYSKYLINTKATRSAHCLRPSIEYFTNYSIADMLWQLIIDRHVSPRLPRLSQHFAHDIFKYWWKLILFREEAHTCMIEHLLCAGDKPERFACALKEMAADDGLWVNMVGWVNVVGGDSGNGPTVHIDKVNFEHSGNVFLEEEMHSKTLSHGSSARL